MPEMHLRYTYYACEPFTKSKERIQKLGKKRRFKTYLSTYQNELVKTCFQFDMTYEDFKDLIRKTV